jgi:hypothetical protein
VYSNASGTNNFSTAGAARSCTFAASASASAMGRAFGDRRSRATWAKRNTLEAMVAPFSGPSQLTFKQQLHFSKSLLSPCIFCEMHDLETSNTVSYNHDRCLLLAAQQVTVGNTFHIAVFHGACVCDLGGGSFLVMPESQQAETIN